VDILSDRDREYLERRAEEELAMSRNASCVEAARSHFGIAARYRLQLRQIHADDEARQRAIDCGVA